MGLSKVQARGQVTIPAAVRRAASLAPGDTVVIEAAGKGKVQVTALPVREPLEDVFRRYGGPGAVAPDLWGRVAEDAAREVLGRSQRGKRDGRARQKGR